MVEPELLTTKVIVFLPVKKVVLVPSGPTLEDAEFLIWKPVELDADVANCMRLCAAVAVGATPDVPVDIPVPM